MNSNSTSAAGKDAVCVSVVIPCYNQAEFLREAVDSVLAQTFQDFEIIVVDDGSNAPDSIEILSLFSAPKTRVIRQSNQGRAAARNTGIKNAFGEFILCLDSDDKIGERYLENALDVMRRDDNMGIVSCRAVWFGSRQGEWVLADPDVTENLLFDYCIHSCSMFRRADWELCGGFDSSLEITNEDFDLWLSIIEMGRAVHKIPEILFYYRRHEKSVTASLGRMDEKSKYEITLAANSYLFKKHINLYLRHTDLIIPRLFRRMASDRPKFASLKITKYRLLLKFYKALSNVSVFQARALTRIKKLERKLKNITFYLELR